MSDTPRTDEVLKEINAMRAAFDWNDDDDRANAYSRTECMLEQHARNLESELATIRARTEGMVMVPREPTPQMLWAMQCELPDNRDTLGAKILMKAVYKAMIAAS